MSSSSSHKEKGSWETVVLKKNTSKNDAKKGSHKNFHPKKKKIPQSSALKSSLSLRTSSSSLKSSSSSLKSSKETVDPNVIPDSYVCWNLFHIGACYEWGRKEHCFRCVKTGTTVLNDEYYPCERKSTGIVVCVWTPTDECDNPSFSRIYYSVSSKHPEELAIDDQELNSFLSNHPRSRVIVYTRRQPCHWSESMKIPRKGSPVTISEGRDPISCATKIIEWFVRSFSPFQITLEIKCSDLHKAHWQNPNLFGRDKFAKDMETLVFNAREGIDILLRYERSTDRQISIGGFEEKDWDFLKSRMSEKSRLKLSEEKYSTLRLKHDQKIDKFFDNMRRQLTF